MSDAGRIVNDRTESSRGDETGEPATDRPDPVTTAERRLGSLAEARAAGDDPDIDQLRDAERALLAALGRVRKLKRRTGER